MRIGLDFDGVLSDCLGLKAACAKEFFGVDIPANLFKREHVVDGGLLTAEQYGAIQNRVYGDREVGLRLDPVAGMTTYLPRLLADGHDVEIITSRTGVMLDIAQEWLAGHSITLRFTGVGHRKSKADAANGIALYVDDDLDKIAPLVGVVPHRFLFSWHYNAHETPGEVAERVASWEDLYARITGIAGDASRSA